MKFENNNGRLARITVMIVAIALMTTSLAMGTFAKYATGDNTASSARVAKWGVTLEITGEDDMFVSNYDGTVIAHDSADVVAPGTKNDTGVVFTIAGTPEVRTRILMSITDAGGNAPKDVYLNYGTDDPATTDVDESVTYYPVKFTLKQIGDANGTMGTPDVLVNGGTLADVQAVLDAFNGKEYAPNTNLGASFQLTWAWAFGNADNAISGNDIYDTALGDLAAGLTVTEVGGETINSYCLSIDYKIDITIVQVD